jgi:amidohydrolase
MNPYLSSALANFDQIREHRRDFHRHAELGFHEKRTAGKIAEYLRALGLEVKTGIAKTGVVGLLCCKESGKTAALRADIDALPMEEKNDVPYASVNPGVAHACGHDGHAAVLMETARLLTENAEKLKGNVKFIFQPCEDMIPSGALPMIEEGVLENPAVDGIFTLHVSTSHDLGTLWVKRDYISISSAGFKLILRGKGGHVSQPHRGVDPINMAALLITGSQNLMLKSTQPGKPIVFAFGTIHGGTADNIIPDEVVLSGSIRTATPEDREKAIEDFQRIVKGIADTAGGSHQLDIELQNPSMYNAPEMVDLLKSSAAKVIGEHKVNEFNQIMPGGDDAAYFQQKVPGVYWILGARNEDKGFVQPGHSPFFDFDEDALPIGAAVQAQAVTDFLLGSTR